jgi:hypothetical protein
MATAARRLLLKSKSFNYRIAPRQLSQGLYYQSNLRQFSSCSPQLRGKKSKSSEKAADESKPEDLQEPSQAQIKQWEEEFERRFEETGDVGSVLDMLDPKALTSEQREEVLGMINQLKGLEKKEEYYQNLVQSVTDAADDPTALHELLANADEDPRELLRRKLTDEEREALEEAESMDEYLDDPLNLKAKSQLSLEKALGGKLDMESEMRLPSSEKVDLQKMLEEAEKNQGGSLVKEWLERNSAERSAAKRWGKRDRLLDTLLGVQSEPEVERGKPPAGFWNYGEDEDMGEDEEFQNDDISSKGHEELERHREIREYARYAVWELPLLSSMY